VEDKEGRGKIYKKNGKYRVTAMQKGKKKVCEEKIRTLPNCHQEGEKYTVRFFGKGG
jgi:predicted site-specific integrase-resolvase